MTIVWWISNSIRWAGGVAVFLLMHFTTQGLVLVLLFRGGGVLPVWRGMMVLIAKIYWYNFGRVELQPTLAVYIDLGVG